MNKRCCYFLAIFAIFYSNLARVDSTIYVCLPGRNHTVEDVATLFQFKSRLMNMIQEKSDDPLHIDYFHFDFLHPFISAKGSLDNVDISNILDFDMGGDDGDVFELFHITFNNVSVTGSYDLAGSIGGLFDVFGAGEFWLNVIKAEVKVPLYLDDLFTQGCIGVDLNITTQNIENHFYNLMNDDELETLVNDCISSIGPEIVDVLFGELKDGLNGPLQELIDSIINGKPLEDTNIMKKIKLSMQRNKKNPK